MDPGPVPPELMVCVVKWIVATVMWFVTSVRHVFIFDHPSTVNNTIAQIQFSS